MLGPMGRLAFALSIVAVTAGCPTDPSLACVDDVDLAACRPLYPPTWADVYGNTIERTCASGGVACHAAAGARGGLAPGVLLDVVGTAEVVGARSPCPHRDPARLVETHAYPAGGYFVENPGWLAGGALALALAACGDDVTYQPVEALMQPDTCMTCHPRHTREWASSMHAYAGVDPVFVALNRKGQEDTGGALGSFCVRCHAPVALALGLTTDGLAYCWGDAASGKLGTGNTTDAATPRTSRS